MAMPDYSKLYEELRQVIDGGSESMTHEDALRDLKIMEKWYNVELRIVPEDDPRVALYRRGRNDLAKQLTEFRNNLSKVVK